MNTAKWPALVCAVMLVAGCAGLSSQGGLSDVIAPDAKLELVREGFQFTEGPLPMPDGGLYFTDLRASRVHRIDPQGNISIVHEKTDETNGLAFDRNGDLIGIEAAGARRIRRFGKDGKVSEVTRGDGVHAMLQPNDLIVDAKGGIYFTDPGPRPLVPGRKVHVYYLPPGAKNAIVVDDSRVRPNGLTLTLDGKRLIVDDTVEHTIWQYDIQPDGRLANRRPFARMQNIAAGEDSGGDGLAIDRAGRLFVTSVTGIQIFDSEGGYLGNIPVPRKATNVAFAGPGKSVLYITAREAVYKIQTLTQGPARPGK
jgi:gluconolactonase